MHRPRSLRRSVASIFSGWHEIMIGLYLTANCRTNDVKRADGTSCFTGENRMRATFDNVELLAGKLNVVGGARIIFLGRNATNYNTR